MADDMQMDVEPSFEQPLLQPVVDSNQGNPFFQWQTQNNPQLMDSFAMPSHHQDNSEAYKQAAYISTENSPAESQIPMPDDLGGLIERIPAKMHLRRPGRDNWSYIGRVNVIQDFTRKSPSVVVRLQSNDKLVAAFNETSSVSVDKRGNFIVVASVEPAGVISYSLHASDNSEALRILASIELAAYKLGTLSGTENRQQSKARRRIERTIKEDRRRRHKRRKEDDQLVEMLGGTTLV